MTFGVFIFLTLVAFAFRALFMLKNGRDIEWRDLLSAAPDKDDAKNKKEK